MKIKHSKYKNSGILFELLVRQITSDTLEGKDSPIKEILKKYFVKTELGKEYKLYETLLNKTSLTEARADLIITTLIESSKNLNRRIIRQQKYNLIAEITKHYDLNEFFNHKLPHYKVQAAFYTLLEIYNSPKVTSPKYIINNKMTILEHLTAAKIKEEEVRDNVRAITHLRNTISKLFPEEGDQWIQTSYNNNFRKIFASIGLLYSDKGDVFYPPQPYASWTLDSNYDWQAPIAVPSELSELTAPEVYDWDEDVYQADNTKGWVKIE